MNIVAVSDGASHRNGSTCGIGIVLYDADNQKQLTSKADTLGEGTNIFAEYMAAIEAVKLTMEYVKRVKTPVQSIVFLTDSNHVIQQVSGKFQTKQKEMREWRDTLRDMLADIEELVSGEVTLDYAPREYTHEADELARSVVEEQVSDDFGKKYPFLKP